jgi:hypothetical protein
VQDQDVNSSNVGYRYAAALDILLAWQITTRKVDDWDALQRQAIGQLTARLYEDFQIAPSDACSCASPVSEARISGCTTRDATSVTNNIGCAERATAQNL